MDTRRTLLFLFITLVLIFKPPGKVFSQDVTQIPDMNPVENEEFTAMPEGTESCFSYYSYNKVKVNLTADKESYKLGEKIILSGTIKNGNTFPLVGVSLYTHLRRINEDTKSVGNNGHFLVDRIFLVDSLNFLPGELKHLTIPLDIKAEYPNGNYVLQYFINSPNGFNYSGRGFLDDDIAGSTSLAIDTGNKPDVYFDIDNFKINGEKKNLREFDDVFAETVINYNIEIPVIDKRVNKTPLNVKIAYYDFDDTFKDLLEKSEEIVLPAGKSTINTSFLIPRSRSAAYVVLAEIDAPVKSIIKYRIKKNGSTANTLRINDLGITDYPVGNESKAYVCFHSPADALTPETTVNLAIFDDQKNQVDSTTISGSFPGDVLAISLPLTKIVNKDDFYINTSLGEKIDLNGGMTIHYTRDLFTGAVGNIDVQYPGGDKLAIRIGNIDNEEIKEGGYLESVVIRDEKGNIVQEKYVLDNFDGNFSLGDLPDGKYTAEVISGENSTTKEFTLKRGIRGVGVAEKTKLTIIIFSILGIVLLLIIAFILYKKMKKKDQVY